MKKILKKLSLLGISAALLLSFCFAGVGCSPSGDGNISVYVFGSDAEKATYQNIIDTWEEEYAQKLREEDPETYGPDFTIEVNLRVEAKTDTYYSTLRSDLSAGVAQDIFYVSPGNVQSYVTKMYLLNLIDYMDFSEQGYDLNDLWNSALSFYSYSNDSKVNESVTYDAEKNTLTNGDGKSLGLYALPKDYSSFTTAYNVNFFTDKMTARYENTADTHGAVYVYGTTPAAGTLPTNATQASSIIKPGTTLTYYPFNYYRFYDLKTAYENGDPVAKASVANGGYDVTIPCYPNEVLFDEAATDDPSTTYDDRYVYPVYTYSEYSALSFAVAYYCTMYDSGRADADNDGKVAASDYPSDRWTNCTWISDKNYSVYANDQYDSSGTYYLTSWLYGNDASVISPDNQHVDVTLGGETSETSSWGINSDAFIEAYSAFNAYGSDWNNNMYWSATITEEETLSKQGGYVGFAGGYCVFYGYGTWNSTTLDKDKSVLDYQLMATPVSDDHSLNSRIKNMHGESEEYGSDASTFTESDIASAMKSRQSEWGARVDSVGYGVNRMCAEKYTGKNAWKLQAAIDLCAYMTIDKDAQVSLTYAGAQIPNYVSQCEDYLNTDGAFAGMITPGSENWNEAYGAAMKIAAVTAPKQMSMTITEWLTASGYSAEFIEECLNPIYADSLIKDFNSTTTAFRLFNIVSLNDASRNLLLRIAETNGAKDPCLYTYNNSWWASTFATYEGSYLLNYNLDPTQDMYSNYTANKDKVIGYKDLDSTKKALTTVYNYCQALARHGEIELWEVIDMSMF